MFGTAADCAISDQLPDVKFPLPELPVLEFPLSELPPQPTRNVTANASCISMSFRKESSYTV